MKKSMGKKCLLCLVLLAGALGLTGCGEEPYELEDNEKSIIVSYAAHIVAKYNVKQPEGYRYVYVPEEEELPEEDTPEEAAGDETPEEPDAADTPDTPEDGTDAPADGADTPEEAAVTLSEALGLTGVRAVYTGAELTDKYESVLPDAGKKLMILHVTLQNTGTEDAECDILSQMPVFRAKVNGTLETTAELTILTENLGTWEDPVPAGGSVDTIIMFQVSETGIDSVEQLEMSVTIGQDTSKVVFL